MKITFESILNYLSSKITEVSTQVGSFAYFILSAVTYKLLDLEGKIYANKQNMDIDTADSEGIDTLAKQQGLTRKDATTGVAKGQFDVEIPNGSRFQIGEVVWVSGEFLSESGDYKFYRMTSEQTGAAVNKGIGKLDPITYIEGLNYAYTIEMITEATDKESDEQLKERYKGSFKTDGCAGNKTYYRELVNNMVGVGGCKVYPVHEGAGTVGITVISSEYGVPSSTLIDDIQDLVDPDKLGEGDGRSPIGAKVTISGVTNQDITIGVKCQFESGTFADWVTEITNIINSYFLSLNKTWANSSEVVVRRAEIISKLVESDKIVDVLKLTINDDEENNLILDNDKIAHLEGVIEIA